MIINAHPSEAQGVVDMGVAHARMWLALYGKFVDPKYLGRFDEAVLIDQWHRLLTSDPAGKRIAITMGHRRIIGVAMTVPTIRIEDVTPPACDREVSMYHLMLEYQGQGIGRRLLECVISPREPVQLWPPSGYGGEKRAHRICRRAEFLSGGTMAGHEVDYGLALNRMVRW